MSLEVWLLIVAVGVGTGLIGAGLMSVLHAVQHLAFGYTEGAFGPATQRASPGRRIAALAVAGLVGGVGWYLLRRVTAGESSDLDDELWTGTGDLSFRRSLGTSVLSIAVVGAGASLGREAAPKLMGGVLGSMAGRWRRLSVPQRRLLVACGAGAGLGAVYDVPLGGALLTAELLLGSLTLPVILPALACSWIATAVAWVYLPVAPTYTDVPAYTLHISLVIFAVVVGPLIGLFAVGWIRLIGWVAFHRVRGPALLIAPLLAFTLVGVAAIWYPEILGNGKDLAHWAFLSGGQPAFSLLIALVLLKPAATALCLGSGATGGLFTPTLSTGAVLGVLFGRLWTAFWPGSPLGAYAVIAASALIGAAMQTPLAALALVIEMTHTADTLIVPMIAATALATILARYLDGYSIYSSRLPPRPSTVTQGKRPDAAGERL